MVELKQRRSAHRTISKKLRIRQRSRHTVPRPAAQNGFPGFENARPVALFGDSASSFRYTPSNPRFPQDPANRFRHRGRVVGRHQQAAPAVLDEVGIPPTDVVDDAKTASHRLDDADGSVVHVVVFRKMSPSESAAERPPSSPRRRTRHGRPPQALRLLTCTSSDPSPCRDRSSAARRRETRRAGRRRRAARGGGCRCRGTSQPDETRPRHAGHGTDSARSRDDSARVGCRLETADCLTQESGGARDRVRPADQPRTLRGQRRANAGRFPPWSVRR